MPSIALPDVLDRMTVDDLASLLLSKRGSALVLDARGLERLSGIGLEMLVAAKRQWKEDGQTFVIQNWSQQGLAALAQLGAADMRADAEAAI